MDICEILEFVDKIVYNKTGNYLSDIQRGIIEGTLKQQRYAEIAETYRRSEGHVKDVGYELLQILSDAFGRPIDKGNLKSVLNQKGNLNISNSNIIGSISVGSLPSESPDEKRKNVSLAETISKLRDLGLSDDQVADSLGISLEDLTQIR